ncbi:MAG: helix-turn-helix domain-containing protein [Flavobacteriaceae bacterium]|nr:helix-turn-helix domain-containing protein [Flavobacteriaceae bacterium]
MKYNRFTFDQREKIEEYLAENYSYAQIADELKRSKSSIYREINRNSSRGKYIATKAHQKAVVNMKRRKPKKMTVKMKNYINRKVMQFRWSPQKIRKKALESGMDMVSVQRIYEYIREDKEKGGILHERMKIGFRKEKLKGS